MQSEVLFMSLPPVTLVGLTEIQTRFAESVICIDNPYGTLHFLTTEQTVRE